MKHVISTRISRHEESDDFHFKFLSCAKSYGESFQVFKTNALRKNSRYTLLLLICFPPKLAMT
jgi:hypothetical protein